LDKAIAIARAFLRWWVAELAACVPARLKKRFARTPEAVVLQYGGDLTHVDPALRRRLEQGKAAVTIRLPADSALITRVSLPAAAAANLAEVLRFELDRRTPFSADDVHFTHRIVERDQAKIDVALTVARKTVVEDAVAKATALGLRVTAVDVDGEPGNLLSAVELPDRRKRVVARARYAAAFAAFAALVYLPIHQAEVTAIEAQREAAAARKNAEAVARQKEQLAKASEAARFLVARKQAAPSVSEILNELTRVLPDNTYLVQLDIRDGEIQFAGLSGATSELFPLIDRSPVLAEPKFRSAVTLDQVGGRERFEIGAKIVRKPPQ